MLPANMHHTHCRLPMPALQKPTMKILCRPDLTAVCQQSFLLSTAARLQEANDDGVVIATYDCTTNEEPSDPKLSVNGYPTTYFLSASGKGG